MFSNLNIKKISLWLSLITLSCFAIATLLFFQIDLKELKNNKYQYEVNEQKSFETKQITDINIDSFSSNINVIEYDDTNVKVHVYGKLYSKNKNEENKPLIKLTNGKLNIKDNRKSKIQVGINLNLGVLFQENEMQIDLFVPKGYKEKMNIDSSSGSVKADSLELKELEINTFSSGIELKDVTANKVKLETSSGTINAGNISADNIKIISFSGNNDFKSLSSEEVYIENSSGRLTIGTVKAKEITADTFSGDITAQKVIADDVDINTSAGKIRIEDAIIKKINCETYSGDITFNNAAIGDLQLDTSSGNVLLRLLASSEFQLVAESESGKVACDFPINILEDLGEHELKGAVGSDTNKININTFSGDITVSK